MNIEIYKDADHLARELAEWITGLIEETLTRKESFSLVLSGGSTPKKLHHLLAASPFRERIDWKKIYIFWGDERAVPLEDGGPVAGFAGNRVRKAPVARRTVEIPVLGQK